MSLREELNRAIDAADHYDRHGVMPTWARMALTKFVGNHGQAILDALEDGARLDWMDANPFTAYRDRDPATGKLTNHVTVVNEDRIPRTGCVMHDIRQAIDAAIKGDGAKPTP